jgi:hypothetical protein
LSGVVACDTGGCKVKVSVFVKMWGRPA